MLYTQIAGITISHNINEHILSKEVYQIYSSAIPVNVYGNSGDIAKTIIKAQYIGVIGMGII